MRVSVLSVFCCWKCWNVENLLSVFGFARSQFCVGVNSVFSLICCSTTAFDCVWPFDVFRNPIDDLRSPSPARSILFLLLLPFDFHCCCCLFYLWLILFCSWIILPFSLFIWCKSPSVSVCFSTDIAALLININIISCLENHFRAFDCVVAVWFKYLLIIKRNMNGEWC